MDLILQPQMLCRHPAALLLRRSREVHSALVLSAWLTLGGLPAVASAALSTNGESSAIAVYSVLVDGRPQQIPARMQLLSQAPGQPASVAKGGKGRLRVPSLAQRVEFRF